MKLPEDRASSEYHSYSPSKTVCRSFQSAKNFFCSTLVDEIAYGVLVAMRDRDHVPRQLGVEAGDRLVEMGQLVSQNHRHRQARRAVNADHVAALELAGGDHLVEARLRILDNLIVLGRSPEPHLEDAVGERDVVSSHFRLLFASSAG